jgi:hypothetical protein
MWTRPRLRYVTNEAAQAFGFFPESTRTIAEQITTIYRNKHPYGGILFVGLRPTRLLFTCTARFFRLEHSTKELSISLASSCISLVAWQAP